MSSNRLVLWPPSDTKVLACMGSQTQTTGCSDLRTASRIGGSSDRDL